MGVSILFSAAVQDVIKWAENQFLVIKIVGGGGKIELENSFLKLISRCHILWAFILGEGFNYTISW